MSIEISNESAISIDESKLQRILRFAMGELFVHPDADLALILVDEPAMTQLHIEWMDEEGPTDVLSFPMDELRPGNSEDPSEQGILGDIVICPQVAKAQAKEAGHPLLDEVLMLTVHGLLHLLGYDHAEPDEEKEMFGLQKSLLAAFAARDSDSNSENTNNNEVSDPS
ncbi:MAG: rRNA maturation RNase YbeY [Microbacteriaceae bacterium]